MKLSFSVACSAVPQVRRTNSALAAGLIEIGLLNEFYSPASQFAFLVFRITKVISIVTTM
jgi:hypothetical protein